MEEIVLFLTIFHERNCYRFQKERQSSYFSENRTVLLVKGFNRFVIKSTVEKIIIDDRKDLSSVDIYLKDITWEKAKYPNNLFEFTKEALINNGWVLKDSFNLDEYEQKVRSFSKK